MEKSLEIQASCSNVFLNRVPNDDDEVVIIIHSSRHKLYKKMQIVYLGCQSNLTRSSSPILTARKKMLIYKYENHSN